MSEPGCYIGRCKCGAIVAACVDTPDRKKETAKDVAEFISDGLTVERMSVEDVRAGDWKCKCPKDMQLDLPLEKTG
jgi:hypothetical protein